MTKLDFWGAFSIAKGYLKIDASKSDYYFRMAESLVESGDHEVRESRRALLRSVRDKVGIAKTEQKNTPIIKFSPDLQSVDSLVAGVSDGISLVSCCKNRNDNLCRAILSWLALDEISEIVIVDWDSEHPVRDSLEQRGIRDSRIKIVRVEGQPRWILSHAFNLGFRVSSYNRILKVDADIVIDSEFFQKNTLREKAFLTGDWRIAEAGQEYINGFFFAWRSDLLAIKGFNEYIVTYGWDDDDIYGRLEGHGLERDRVDPKTINHLPHDDSERVHGLADLAGVTALTEIKRDTSFSIFKNKLLCSAVPEWNGDRNFVPFGVVSRAEGYLEVVQAGEHPHSVSDSIVKCVEYLALNLLSSWKFGPDVYKLPDYKLLEFLDSGTTSQLRSSNALSTFTRSERTVPELLLPKKKLFIDAQHGLGNRLRAIASAAAIAEQTDRELVIVWEPDHHCECRLSDLFEYKGALIERSFIDDARKECDVFNYMEIEAGAVKDQEIHSARSIYARSAYVLNSAHTNWDAENRFLKSLMPSREVSGLLEPFDLRNCIGAHVRMEAGEGLDHNSYDSIENWTEEGHAELHYWREKSHYSHFIKRIDQIFAQDRNARLFLATDMPETYDIFARYYGDKMSFLPRRVYDRSREQIIYALADVILLSRCSRLLGSTWSSFSEIAIRLSNTFTSVEMSGENF